MSCQCLLCFFPCFSLPPCTCLSPSVCQHYISSVLSPLVTTPGLLPPLSPHLFFVWSLVSVYLVCSCGPIQGLHTSRTRPLRSHQMSVLRCALQASSTLVKWDSLLLGSFPGCITRCSLPDQYVTFYAAQVRKVTRRVV